MLCGYLRIMVKVMRLFMSVSICWVFVGCMRVLVLIGVCLKCKLLLDGFSLVGCWIGLFVV